MRDPEQSQGRRPQGLVPQVPAGVPTGGIGPAPGWFRGALERGKRRSWSGWSRSAGERRDGRGEVNTDVADAPGPGGIPDAMSTTRSRW